MDAFPLNLGLQVVPWFRREVFGQLAQVCTVQTPFLSPSQQYQSTEETSGHRLYLENITHSLSPQPFLDPLPDS